MLPGIHEKLCGIDPGVQGPYYVDVEQIEESWVSLYIRSFCLGKYNIAISRRLQREQKLMCERNGIIIPVQQIKICLPEDQAEQS